MEKYLVRFAECDDCVIDVFKVDLEKDIYLKCMTDDEYSFSEGEKKEFINGERGTPSRWLRTYPETIFDTLEEAEIDRSNSIDEFYEC